MSDELFQRASTRIGNVLRERWRLDAVLGVGGMGTVYRATHRNGRLAAIKILHTELLVDDELRKRFLREGYIANAIEHPGAVAVIDDDVADDGSPFLVMELLQGDTVERYMERFDDILPASMALEIADRLLDVLACAHDHGVVHRDIKPANLFITSHGQLKVLDFGIARVRTRSGSTRMGLFLGTPGFASPEQARSRPDTVDARADLYAIGATLFTMLTGRYVHEAETETERLALTISQPARSLATLAPGLPRSVITLVDRALLYDREERWLDAREMRVAVRKALADLAAAEHGAEHEKRDPAHVFDLAPYDVSHTPRRRAVVRVDASGVVGLDERATSGRWRSRLGLGIALVGTVLFVLGVAIAIRFATSFSVIPVSVGPSPSTSATPERVRPTSVAQKSQSSASAPALPATNAVASSAPNIPSAAAPKVAPHAPTPSAAHSPPRPASPSSRPKAPKAAAPASGGTTAAAPENQVFLKRR